MPRSRPNQAIWWMLLTIVIVLGSGCLFVPKQRIAQLQYEQQKPMDLPAESPAPVSTTDQEKIEREPLSDPSLPEPEVRHPVEPPDELNLDVPFTSQAPQGVWDDHTQEYCEEASVLMVARYFNGRRIAGPDDALAALQELEAWELEHFGFFKSTTAEQTAGMIEAVYELEAEVRSLTSMDDIKRAFVDGALIILPAAGRELGNPYFKQPGPIYHMLVVKGYTDDGKFITNDPGTKRGADFVYDAATLFDAVGDYNNNDPANGAKVMIVVERS